MYYDTSHFSDDRTFAWMPQNMPIYLQHVYPITRLLNGNNALEMGD